MDTKKLQKNITAGNDTFLTENITQDRKRFIAQSKHDILIK